MTCADIESLMIDYLDNLLEKNQREDVEEHFNTCERCLDELKEFKKIFDKIESEEAEQPNETVRVNFFHMLHSEINKEIIGESKTIPVIPMLNMNSPFMKIAAGIVLLVAGVFIGMMLSGNLKNNDDKSQLGDLQTEVQHMKEMLILTLLKEESPSERIQAVDYTEGLQVPDGKILDALTQTLNHDKNVNVRLAAAYSLAKYSDRQVVRDSLVESLSRQTEPIIQVVLMNILVELNEGNAVKPMKQILLDEKTLQEVKDIAQKGINTLM